MDDSKSDHDHAMHVHKSAITAALNFTSELQSECTYATSNALSRERCETVPERARKEGPRPKSAE